MINRILFTCIAFVFVSCSSHVHLNNITEATARVDENSAVDSEVEAYIAPFRSTLSAEMDAVIGKASISLTKGKPESTLGNWVSQAIHDYVKDELNGKVDLAFQNYGGLRISEIRKGDVTRGKIFELMPFDNLVHVLELDQAVAQKFLNQVAAEGGWPVSSGLKMKVREGIPSEILINGVPLSEMEKVHIALPDYIANGGGDCFYLMDQPKTEYAVLIRDLLIATVTNSTKKGESIGSEITNRITIQ